MFLFDSQLFWYRLVFLTELLVSEGLFTFRLKKRTFFTLRAVGAVVACYLLTFLFPIFSFDALYASFMFLVLFAFTVGGLAFCYREPFVKIIFCSLASYAVQHLAYEFYSFLVTVFGLDIGNASAYGSSRSGAVGAPSSDILLALKPIVYADAYVVTYWACYLLFGLRVTKSEDLTVGNVPVLALAFTVFLVDILLNAVITYRVTESSDRVFVVVECIYNMICSLLVLFLQFTLVRQKKMEKENDTIRQLWHEKQTQYELAKENIEIINLKCHDLKHRLRVLGNASADSEEIKEIEKTVSIYDSVVKTGNEALDVILTEKSLRCTERNIAITCMADGECLSFMSAPDIYSLFGNALDNAIEAVEKVEESDKRTVGLVVKTSRNFVSVSVQNYFSESLVFERGLPVTTKEDKRYHGFGLKSIRWVAAKYDGTVSVTAEDGVFCLNVLFPRGETA